MLNLNIQNSKKKRKRLCISRGLRFRHFAEGNATITPACITINLKTAKDIEGKHQSPRLPEFYVVLSGDSVINFWLQHFPGCLALRCCVFGVVSFQQMISCFSAPNTSWSPFVREWKTVWMKLYLLTSNFLNFHQHGKAGLGL